jgi:putative inorganic carbon (hco3(-)) transporter
VGDTAQAAGMVAASAAAALALVVRAPLARASALVAGLVLATAVLLGHVWSTTQVQTLRDDPRLTVVLVVAALAAVGVVAWIFDRRPALLPPVAAVALPFRVPIDVGGETANLLVPLYLVVAAGAVAYLLRAARDPDAEERRPGALEWALGVVLVLYAVQATYSSDISRALEPIVFFYVPFAVLFVLLVRVAWTTRLAAWTLGVLVAVAVALVGVGFWEYGTKHLLLNPRVINSNAFESYFRVNSLFFDPNIYGRFLIIVMIAIAAVVAWTARAKVAAAGALLLALLWAGLVLTFSQSSFVALLVGLAVIAAFRWGGRRALTATAVVAVIGAAVVLLAPGALRLDLGSDKSVQDATSGRYDLIAGGGRLFADKPIAGWGSGSFRREYRRSENTSAQRATNASHTIPVTVAAEQGIIGLAAYVALLLAALWRLFARMRRAGPATAARVAVAAAFVALLVHTLLYAAYLEDPLTWALLALGTGLAALPDGGAQRPAADGPARRPSPSPSLREP